MRANEDPIEIILRMEQSLSEITDICFDFHLPNPGTIKPADFSPICQFLHTSPAGKQACQKCTQEAIEHSLNSGLPTIVKCHIGLNDAYVPLIVDGRNVGILSCGQFLFEKPTESTYSEMQKRFRSFDLFVEEETMRSFSIPVFSERKFKALTAFMSGFGFFLSAAERHLEYVTMKSSIKPIERAKFYIASHYAEDLTLQFVSKCCSISCSRLSHLFKDVLGLTFTRYLNEFRLQKARNLIVNSDLSVMEIALQVGFRSISHFNHLFRRTFSTNPLSLREQNRTILQHY